MLEAELNVLNVERKKKEHIYEVKQLFPHCVLLEDIYDHTRICPCYSKLSLMLRGIE